MHLVNSNNKKSDNTDLPQMSSAGTFWVKLYLAGTIDFAKQILRHFCKERGLCVTIEETTYIYTGGEEIGYVVGLINYPKYPKTPKEITKLAFELGAELRTKTYQDSFTLMTPTDTYHVTTR